VPPTPAPALPAAPPAAPAGTPSPWWEARRSWSLPGPVGKEPRALGCDVLLLPGSPEPEIRMYEVDIKMEEMLSIVF
jgi:hypothetical protein